MVNATGEQGRYQIVLEMSMAELEALLKRRATRRIFRALC